MTGRIFTKLLLGAFCLLVVALVTVDFFAARVAESSYIANLKQELADKGRMASLMGALKVEHPGTQNQSFNYDQFHAEFEEQFGYRLD